MTTLHSKENSINIEQLRKLIGARVDHEGVRCEIIEILEDHPTLILQDCELHPVIQTDQHGEPHRRVPTTRTVAIFSQESGDFTSAFLELGLLDLTRRTD